MNNKIGMKFDIKKYLSQIKSKAVATDSHKYFRGRLQEVELAEVNYSEDTALDLYSERTKDEGKKIQLIFKFELFAGEGKEPIKKFLRTGTNFSKQVINQKYASRGNKVMKSILNQFTEICLRLKMVTPEELYKYDDILTEKIENILKEYNDRKEEEKILIAPNS